MNCLRCGTNLNQGELFCHGCGYQVTNGGQNDNVIINNQNQMNNQFNNMDNSVNSVMNQSDLGNSGEQNGMFTPQTNFSNNSISDDFYEEDMLIMAYMGKRTAKFVNGTFSWCAFFLGVFYAFYRKMWGYGLLWIGVGMGASLILGWIPIVGFIVPLIVSIYFAKNLKSKYVELVVKRVRTIKQKNQDKSHDELLVICKRKGGVSYLMLLLGILPFILIIALIVVFSIDSVNRTKNRYDQMLGSNVDVSKVENIKFNDLFFDVPVIFQRREDSTVYNGYYHSVGAYCELYVNSDESQKYGSLKQYVENTMSLRSDNQNNELIETSINNNYWSYLNNTGELDDELNTSKTISYFYATKNNDRMYGVELYILYDSNNICSQAKDIVIKSLKFN